MSNRLIKAGRFQEALANLSRALLLSATSHALHALRAEVYSSLNQWDKALEDYERAMKLVAVTCSNVPARQLRRLAYQRRLIDVFVKRADLYRQRNDWTAALADYKRAMIYRGKNHEIQDRVLECLTQLNQYGEFLNLLQSYLVQANADRRSHLLTCHARFLIERRQLMAARELLHHVVEQEPGFEPAHYQLRVIQLMGQEAAIQAIAWNVHGYDMKALTCVSYALDCEPDNIAYALLKGILFRLAGKLDEAQEWLETVRVEISRAANDETCSSKIKNSAEILEELPRQACCVIYDRAVMYLMNGQYDKALQIFDSFPLYQGAGEICIQRGDCLRMKGDLVGALRQYSQVVNVSMSHPLNNNEGLAERIAATCVELSRMKLIKAQDFVFVEYYTTKALKALRGAGPLCDALRSDALTLRARAMYMTGCAKEAAQDLASSLTLQRGKHDDGNLYRVLFGSEVPLTKVVARYATCIHNRYKLKCTLCKQ